MPDHKKVSHVTPIVIYPDDTDQGFLEDLSSKDHPWDKHRRNADIISRYYKDGGYDRYSERVYFCARTLSFKLVSTDKRGTKKLKLFQAQFCRVRHCPVCQWRRSLRWRAKAYEALPKVINDFPDHRWLFVTFTIRNCELTDLRDTLDHLNKSFVRLTQLKSFPGLGWIKSVEVTRGKDGQTAHPHLHCMILLKPSYFKTDYLSKSDWIRLWRQSLRTDYSPIIDVKAVKPDKSPVGLIAEVLKYQCKESDLIADRNWFLEYTRQVHKTRAISVGGVLRSYFSELEREPEDLIGNDGENEQAEEILQFRWNPSYKKYLLIVVYPSNTRIGYDDSYEDTG